MFSTHFPTLQIFTHVSDFLLVDNGKVGRTCSCGDRCQCWYWCCYCYKYCKGLLCYVVVSLLCRSSKSWYGGGWLCKERGEDKRASSQAWGRKGKGMIYQQGIIFVVSISLFQSKTNEGKCVLEYIRQIEVRIRRFR